MLVEVASLPRKASRPDLDTTGYLHKTKIRNVVVINILCCSPERLLLNVKSHIAHPLLNVPHDFTDANSDNAAWVATYMAGTLKASHMI